MDKNTGSARVTSKGAGFINGELISLNAEAVGSLAEGTIETTWELSALPKGFSLLTLVDCTSSGVSLIFAREIGGGQNLLSLSGGNYRVERRFDYGPYGSFRFGYEIRTSGDEVTATGIQEGRLQLPALRSADLSLVELLVPAGPGRIQGFMQTTKVTEQGETIPVSVTGVYSALDGFDDWTLGVPPQARRSDVEITEASKPNQFALRYTTVIERITASQPSAS
jgi:hypothetical protein